MSFLSTFIIINIAALINIFYNDKIYLSKMLFITLVIYIIIFAGLRYQIGYDYFSYLDWFKYSIDDGFFEDFRKEPLFLYLNYITNYVGINYNIFLLIIATISISLKSYIIFKYSKFIFISLLYFIGAYLLIDEMGQFRHALASGILLFSLHFLIERKTQYFLFFWIIASMIHISSIVFIVAFIFIKKDILSHKLISFTLLILSLFLSLVPLKFLLYTAVSLLSFLGFAYSGYIESSILTKVIGMEEKGITIGTIYYLFLTIFLIIYYSKLKNKFKEIIFFGNVFFAGVLIYFSFNSVQLLAGRLSQSFLMSEIIIVPALIILFKPKLISRLIFLILISIYSYTKYTLPLNTGREEYREYKIYNPLEKGVLQE